MELMLAVLERGNMMRAYERVLRNKGAPGVDDMTVGDLKAHLKAHWPEIREQLLEGRYPPLAVRKVEIPKPGGGTRMLGNTHCAGSTHPTGPASDSESFV